MAWLRPYFMAWCSAQNVRNAISGLQISKNFRGGMPPDPLVMRDLGFCYSQILSWIRPWNSKSLLGWLIFKDIQHWFSSSLFSGILSVSFIQRFFPDVVKCCGEKMLGLTTSAVLPISLIIFSCEWTSCSCVSTSSYVDVGTTMYIVISLFTKMTLFSIKGFRCPTKG